MVFWLTFQVIQIEFESVHKIRVLTVSQIQAVGDTKLLDFFQVLQMGMKYFLFFNSNKHK